MPDVRALYSVMAVVVIGLAAWVVSVLLRADRLDETSGHDRLSPETKPNGSGNDTSGTQS